jgi:hypothetical protein
MHSAGKYVSRDLTGAVREFHPAFNSSDLTSGFTHSRYQWALATAPAEIGVQESKQLKILGQKLAGPYQLSWLKPSLHSLEPSAPYISEPNTESL